MPPIIRKPTRFLLDAAVWAACALAVALWPVRLLRKIATPHRCNSIWAATPIINMAVNAKAERLLGVNAKSLVYTTYFITNAFDINLSRWSTLPVVGRLLPLGVFLWACVVADRFHFYCDQGLLPPREPFAFDCRELYVYKLLNIPVFLWTYGADVRNRATCRATGEPNCCTHCDSPGAYCICDPAKAMDKMARLRRLSVAIFAGVGDMFGYVPGSVDTTHYWPIDLEADGGRKYAPAYVTYRPGRPLRIVHSTNHRRFKGTDFLIQAVDDLVAEGLEIELILVERTSNDEALQIYRTADLIFDQCVMGNYGYFALEAMALGKPVMCYIRGPERYLLHPEECPIINTHVSTLKEDLRLLVTNHRELEQIGRHGRRYVEKHFSLEAFARRLGRAYQNLGIAPQRELASTASAAREKIQT